MSYCLGVDLGTTFVAAAVARDDGVRMVALGDRSVVMPAMVYVADDGAVLTGEAADRRVVSNPDQVAVQIKRRLGDPTPLLVGGSAHSATDLLGTLLQDVLDRVAAEEGGPPERLMLSRPPNWGPYQQRMLDEVLRFAGAQNWQTVAEPVAAAVQYAATRAMAVGEVIAVYDLGGGTFDATVLSRTAKGIEVLGTPQGIERLGGVDLDEAILSFVTTATGGALTALDRGDASTLIALARLRQDCMLAKEALSVDEEATIPVFLPGRHLEVELSRLQFEDIIRAHVDSTIGALRRALESASITPDRLSTVLLVGGASQIPLVARMIEEQLVCRTVVDGQLKNAVALGAAALARSVGPADTGAPGVPLGNPPAPDPSAPQPRRSPVGSAAPSDPVATGAPSGPRPVSESSTAAADSGRRRRGVAVVAGLLLVAGVGTGLGVTLSSGPTAGRHQPTAGAPPSGASPGTTTERVSTAAVALPTDVPGLVNALTADGALAGAQTQPLVAQLDAVAAGVGEARRQAALDALGTVRAVGVPPRLTAAVTVAVSPFTVLNTPADMIADLQPTPTLGGPNAPLVLGCMQEFLGRTPQEQQEESQEILLNLPTWSANGGVRADLVDATVRIVTPVAQGRKAFDDVETGGGTPATPGGS